MFLYIFLGLSALCAAAWAFLAGAPLIAKMAETAEMYAAANTALAAVLPLILIALTALVALSIATERLNRRAMLQILAANTRALDGIQVIARQLIEVRKLGQSAQFLQFLPMLLNDTAQSLGEVLAEAGIASEVVMFDALSKEGEARVAAITGALASWAEQTPNAIEMLRREILKNNVLAGKIAIFGEKFARLANTLAKHDGDKALSIVIEEGGLGKSLAILNRARGAAKHPHLAHAAHSAQPIHATHA
ncbi:MAG: hypothetical protein LBH41_02800 [Rickettsiales bacterium]|jgi:hypothetical protein|nr:hypothetical protein [Rickettsiales bacterium]